MALKTLTRFLGMSSLLYSLGCAAAYDRDPCCGIDCRYDATKPLPWTKYDSDVCHSETASHYLGPQTLVAPSVPTTDDEATLSSISSKSHGAPTKPKIESDETGR